MLRPNENKNAPQGNVAQGRGGVVGRKTLPHNQHGATYRLHVRRVAPPHVKKTVTPRPDRGTRRTVLCL